MIVDRTRKDVIDAIEIRRRLLQGVTEEEILILERGMLTVNTLNRIEDKISELKAKVNALGYYNTPITTRNWSNTDVFYKKDFEKILSNIDKIKQNFFALGTSPSYDTRYNYANLNAIEKNLLDIEEIIEYLQNNQIECGNVECGGR